MKVALGIVKISFKFSYFFPFLLKTCPATQESVLNSFMDYKAKTSGRHISNYFFAAPHMATCFFLEPLNMTNEINHQLRSDDKNLWQIIVRESQRFL